MDDTLPVEGVDRKVYYRSAKRAIVSYDGVLVVVHELDDGTWELSGEPANAEEKKVLTSLLTPQLDVTVVTVEKE
jgi:hypothetical protein